MHDFDLALAPAWGGAQSHGLIKQYVEDFRVNEISTIDFSDEGEHLYLKVEKQQLTTEDCCKIFSGLTNIPLKQISYAGLKDKMGITTQWFSIHSPGLDITDCLPDKGDGWSILERRRHHKKLKIGWLKGNQFQILVRQVSAAETLKAKLENIQSYGLPNYYGPQRFGRQGHNLLQAWQWFNGTRKVKKPFLRGILLSAVRSYLFNQQLCARVKHGTWNQVIDGDVVKLANTNSIFLVDNIDDTIRQRVIEHDISPCGLLVGKQRLTNHGQAQALLDSTLAPYQDLVDGLHEKKLIADWRPFVLVPRNMRWQMPASDQLQLCFDLPTGAYATTLLSELFQSAQVQHPA